MTTAVRQTRTTATRVRARALVVLAAVAAAVAVWLITVPVLGLDVTVPDGPGSDTHVDLEVIPVIGMATVASLAGWALLAGLERFTARARTIWTVIAVAVFVVTLPFMPGFTVTERIVLGLLHLAVAAVLIPGLRRTPR